MPANELELLSPAGSMDALKAAVANGADAVYLGASAFGARASAGFDENALKEALALCHLRRKKIYVTVNILVKERELAEVKRTLSLLSSWGADAVLVQDLGILKICREEYPELPVHASTQMALHNASGVRLLQALGAKRAVMARECDLTALREAADTGMEIEAFCHGALCVSCSGQCLFSSMIGGRSGNRGRCAQPCRLPYTYRGKAGAWLSPRDLCARNDLKAMAEAGVFSFKIEGRLKRPEYVAVVTRAYRSALDAVLEGRFRPADPEEKESLVQIFSRGGFTRGYPGGEQDAAIIDPARVTPEGVPLGRVEKVYRKGGALLADVSLIRPLHNGDGLEIGSQELRYSGPETPAGQKAALRLRESVRPGDPVRRTEDESQLAAARLTYEGNALNAALPIPFDAALSAWPGKPLFLTVTDGENEASAEGGVCEAAQSKPLDQETARRSLEKTGGTPFALRSLALRTRDAFAPASALNALRKDALNALSRMRIQAQPRPDSTPAAFTPPPLNVPPPRLIVKTQQAEEIPALLSAGADEVLFLPRDFRPAALSFVLSSLPDGVRLCLPSQCKEETLSAIKALCLARRLPLCLSSPGQLENASGSLMAGEGIPVMNGEAVKLLAYLGCQSVTLSRELAESEIQEIPADICGLILPVYGRARLMLLNHCPMRTEMGLTQNREMCGLCEKGKGAAGTALRDRLGAEYPFFPLHLPEGCVVEMMDSRPLNLLGRASALRHLSWLVVFTDEDRDARLRITHWYAALRRGETPPSPPAKEYLGRFNQGVQ